MLIDRRLIGNAPLNPLNFPYWIDMELRSSWTNLILITTVEDLVNLLVLIVEEVATIVLGFQAMLET